MIMITYSPLTKIDCTITEFLLQHLQEKFSIREIARQAKTDYKLVHTSVQRLVKRKIITKQKYGKTQLCEINLAEAISDLMLVEQQRTHQFFEKNTGIKLLVQEIMEKIENPYYTLIIFGSYAKGTQHQQSDIDILMIVPTKEQMGETERTIHSITSIKPFKTHLLIVTTADFKEMVESRESLNVGKEVVKNHIIAYGAEAFYNMLEGYR